MSAADHETALRRAHLVERLRFRATGATVNEQHITAALHTEAADEIDALVGLLRQTEQRAERAESELVEWRTSIATEALQERAETAERELTRCRERLHG